MPIEILLVIAKNWKQPTVLQWMNGCTNWHIHTLEYYLARKSNEL